MKTLAESAIVRSTHTAKAQRNRDLIEVNYWTTNNENHNLYLTSSSAGWRDQDTEDPGAVTAISWGAFIVSWISQALC